MTENETSFSVGKVDDAVDAVRENIDMFLAAADVNAVFGEPVEHGENLVIPAAEILSVAGFGVGSGMSNNPEQPGGGGGGGGGGRVFSRPVAVIVCSGTEVKVQPVFDFTKIALAGITAFGFMIATAARMQRRRLNVSS